METSARNTYHDSCDFVLLHILNEMLMPFFRSVSGAIFALLLYMLRCKSFGKKDYKTCQEGNQGLAKMLLPLGCVGSIGCRAHQVLDWTPWHDRKGRVYCNRRGGISCNQGGFAVRLLLSACLLNVPVCIWAAPQGLNQLEAFAQDLALGRPEDFPHSACDNLGSEGILNPTTPLPLLVAQVQSEALLEATGEVCDMPSIQVYVMKPCFCARKVSVPCLNAYPSDITEAIRDHMDPVGATDLVVLAQPQPASDFVTCILVPEWVNDSLKEVIILDFSELGGPVFSEYAWPIMYLSVLETYASHIVQSPWQVFTGEHYGPITGDEPFSVKTGQVFKFVRVGAGPCWGPSLETNLRALCTRLAPRWPSERPRCFRLAVFEENCRLFRCNETDEEAFRSEVSKHKLRKAEHMSFGEPLDKSVFCDVLFRGEPVSGVTAVAYRAEDLPPGPAFGNFVFLDARCVGGSISFMLGGQTKRDVHHIFRSLDVKAPPGYIPVIEGVATEATEVSVYDGMVLRLHLVKPAWHPLSGTVSDGAGEPTVSDREACAGSEASGAPSSEPLPTASESLDTGGSADSSTAEVARQVRPGSELAECTRPVWFALFAPDCNAEELRIEVDFPDTIDSISAALQSVREGYGADFFGRLVPVRAQPRDSYGSFICVPQWPSRRCAYLLTAVALTTGYLHSLRAPGLNGSHSSCK